LAAPEGLLAAVEDIGFSVFLADGAEWHMRFLLWVGWAWGAFRLS